MTGDSEEKDSRVPSVWLCHSWYLSNTAKAFQSRGALAAFWMPDKNRVGIHRGVYRRSWPFHLAMKPFYHLTPQIWIEHAFYAFFPLWKYWLKLQRPPECNVVQAIMGFATEPFDIADKTGALKVVDCPNSHPTSYRGYWQRECDLWCPGEDVPIPQWMFSRMNRELERADVVLCPSFFVRDTMLTNGIPAEKLFVNPFGVDLSVFSARRNIPSHPRFISIGTICVRKGFQYLFRAFEQVQKLLPNAELIVVGDYKVDFRKERKLWEGKFTHYRHLPHQELAAMLQTCSAFVFPSTEEGFARVLSEAMACGLPIVASYESGATTLVENGVEGLIVNGRNVREIADAMITISTDHEMNQRMGEASYKKGALKNSWQDYGDRLLEEYSLRLRERDLQ